MMNAVRPSHELQSIQFHVGTLLKCTVALYLLSLQSPVAVFASDGQRYPQMNAAFVQTRRSRRRLILLLQQQQEVLGGHRKLLVCIGELLNEYGSQSHVGATHKLASDIDKDARGLFATLCSDFPLEEWEAARAKETQLGTQRFVTNAFLSVAQKAYDEVAPFGFMSRLGSSDSEKAEIDKRKAHRDALRAQAASIENGINLNAAEIRDKAELFLRSATLAGSIARLISNSPIRDQVREILTGTATKLSSSWKEVSEKQSLSLSESQTHLDLLIGTYKKQNVDSGPMLCLRDGDHDA
jgi:hypothetical protein